LGKHSQKGGIRPILVALALAVPHQLQDVGDRQANSRYFASSQLKSQPVTPDLLPSSLVRSVSGYFSVSRAGGAAVAVLKTV
jgi:hypothetical protein